jgi:hypothetical protein
MKVGRRDVAGENTALRLPSSTKGNSPAPHIAAIWHAHAKKHRASAPEP